MTAIPMASHPEFQVRASGFPGSTSAAPDREIDDLAHALSGDYDNFTQNARDEATRDRLERGGGNADDFYVHDAVRMHIVPVPKGVLPSEEPGQAFYVEQALAAAPGRPYRQRVYFLTRNEEGQLVDRIYRLANAPELVGAWERPEQLQALRPEKLRLQPGCDVTFSPAGTESWHGESGEGGTCRSPLDGALVYSKIDLDAYRLVSLDQGRTPSGELVFGPRDSDGGYEFEKSSCYRFPGS